MWGFFSPSVFSGGVITAAGNEWVVRTDGRATLSDFEVRFRVDAQRMATGTMRGTVADLLSTLQFPNPNRVAVAGGGGAGDAALSGTTFPQLGGVFGTLTGTLSYTDNQGGVTTCTSGLLTVYPAQ